MDKISTSTGFNRRALLSTLAALPILPELLYPNAAQAQAPTAPLPSWNDGPAKQAILDFVRVTTDRASPRFVAPEERIATFDQDGTLWVEHPMYTFMTYALERVPVLAKAKPGLKEIEPFKTVLSGDREAMAQLTTPDFEKIFAAAMTGMTVDEFKAEVQMWLATAKHPRWNCPYTDLAYQPMLEVLQYLRANGYQTYIVSGGGQDFARMGSEKVYGIPPQQVVGTASATKFEYDKEGKPTLIKEPKLTLFDDFGGKPEGIHLMIGRRPYAAFGNSTGDQQMLEYTGAGDGAADDARAARRRDARICLWSGLRPASDQSRHLHAGALRRGEEERLDSH
jgi:phosphoglycolate phosphatase-like HAD superfamily hydrolase